MLISKFIGHFLVDVEGEHEEPIGLLNGVSAHNMHKMGFTKVDNTWVTENDVVVNAWVGAHDHEAGLSRVNQAKEDAFVHELMAIEFYNALVEIGPTYSNFERLVLDQLQELNVSQNEHHAFFTKRFHDLDDQIHNVTDLLSTFYNRDNPRNDWVGWLLGHALHLLCCIHIFLCCCQFLNLLFLDFNRLIILVLVSFSFSFLFFACISCTHYQLIW